VLAAASLWPTGGTVWNTAVRRSALKKLLLSMERCETEGLHRRTSGLQDSVAWVETEAERLPKLLSLLRSCGSGGSSAEASGDGGDGVQRVMVFVPSPALADSTVGYLQKHLRLLEVSGVAGSGGGVGQGDDGVEVRAPTSTCVEPFVPTVACLSAHTWLTVTTCLRTPGSMGCLGGLPRI
jgi:hypothetical protein